MDCKDAFDVKKKVWNEQEEKGRSRGGRSSGWDPGFRTTTFTLFLNLRESRQERDSHLFLVYSTLIYHTEEGRKSSTSSFSVSSSWYNFPNLRFAASSSDMSEFSGSL